MLPGRILHREVVPGNSGFLPCLFLYIVQTYREDSHQSAVPIRIFPGSSAGPVVACISELPDCAAAGIALVEGFSKRCIVSIELPLHEILHGILRIDSFFTRSMIVFVLPFSSPSALASLILSLGRSYKVRLIISFTSNCNVNPTFQENKETVKKVP